MELENCWIAAVALSSLSSESPKKSLGTFLPFEYDLLSTAILLSQYSEGSTPKEGSRTRGTEPGKLS